MIAPLVAIVSFLFASDAFAQAPAKTATAPVKTSPGAGPVIVVETEKGTFEFETYPNEAPKTVAHILGLINKRFYNGQRFHRVIPGFVAQWAWRTPATRARATARFTSPWLQRRASMANTRCSGESSRAWTSWTKFASRIASSE